MFNLNKNKIKLLFSVSVYTAIIQFLQILFTGYFFTLSEYGMLTITQVILNTSIAFADAGILNLLVQKKKLTKSFLDNIFSFLLLFLITFSVLYIFVIYYIQHHFETIQEIGINFIYLLPGLILATFVSYFYNHLVRQSSFDTLSKIDFITVTVQILVFVAFVLLHQGVASLILAWYASITIKFSLLYKKTPFLNFNFIKPHKKILKFFLHYQFFQYLERIINMLSTQADIFFISLLFNTEILGLYAYIKNISLKGIHLVSMLFQKLMFPSFSSLYRNKIKLYNEMKKNINLFAITFFFILPINLIFTYFVLSLFGDKYLTYINLIYYFQLMAFFILLNIYINTTLLIEYKMKQIALLNSLIGMSFFISYVVQIFIEKNINFLDFYLLTLVIYLLLFYLFILSNKTFSFFRILFMSLLFLAIVYFKQYLISNFIFFLLWGYSLYYIYTYKATYKDYFNYA